MSEVQTKTQRSRHKEENWLLIRESCQAGTAQGDFSKRFWSRGREEGR